ncbi:MAG TPA: type II toxin-antitoxin system VapC family toxin [Gemmataceae bacterium]|nr:type II toxin-antitoxin system VapC family toxin [Gemmataceae bacterium]
MTAAVLDCVVDAGVGIKLCITEPDSALADALLALAAASPPTELYVPDLFYIECANIWWKHVQRLGLPRAKAERDMQKLCALRLHRTATADLAVDALQIALDHTISAYDASYVALSGRLGLPLITADDALIRKLAASHFVLKRLTDLSLPPTP